MAQTIKASEIPQETKDRITREVETGLLFLGTTLTVDEVRARVAAILARPDVDELIDPLAVRPDGKPWIMQAVQVVTERVVIGDDLTETAPPAPPPELDQSGSPEVPLPPNAAPPPVGSSHPGFTPPEIE